MYAIVGAGPCGLAIAYLLGRAGKQCVLIEREAEIGGCHRVQRVNGRFTEHSPRVYLSSYRNTMWLLGQMGIRDAFTNYKWNITDTVRFLLTRLSYVEIGYLFLTFVLFLFNPSFGRETSVAEWACRFRPEARELMDRYCRFTDGAGADRYSLNKLLNLVNQNVFYRILQPREPNDVGLFPKIRQAIESTGNVSFRLESTVQRIIFSNEKVSGIEINGETIACDHVLLCLPPAHVSQILTASGILSPAVERLSRHSSYDTYLSATFHWDTPIDIPDVWGFPTSEWGLISIPVSKYFTPQTSSVISTTCFYLDRPSSTIGLTANQISDTQQLLEEMFRQLKETYPGLPRPDAMLLSPIEYYDGGWRSRDSGFIKSVREPYVEAMVREGVYQIGTQNGRSSFAYTTFESAVTNAIAWYNTVDGVDKVVIQNPVKLSRVIYVLLLVYVLVRVLRARNASSSSSERP
jgi:protoporphyrinogen oxidase